MATHPNNIPISNRESSGPSSVDDVRREPDITTVVMSGAGVIPNSQWEWIMSSIAKLDSRLAASEQRTADHRIPPLPDPGPPYAIPLSSAVRGSQPLQQPFFQPVPDYPLHNQPLSTATGHNLSHVPEVNFQLRPQLSTFMPNRFDQHSQPWYGCASDSFDQSRYHSGNLQSGQHSLPQHGLIPSLDRPAYSPLPGPRPTSCWYPSMDRPLRGHPLQDQH